MSGYFPAAPKLSPLWKDGKTDGVNWYLLEDFVYNADSIGAVPPQQIIVPRGFITDFCSTPKALWNLFPPWGKYGCAAIVHDRGYWFQDCPKPYVDTLLLQAMEALGCDPVTCKAIYEAVAIAGQFAWDSNARQKLSGYTRMVAL
jgi:Protein of unknown function (DUF1353)